LRASAILTIGLAALAIDGLAALPSGWPVEICFGTSPSQAAKSRPFPKASKPSS
jgi:hypothetical protein